MTGMLYWFQDGTRLELTSDGATRTGPNGELLESRPLTPDEAQLVADEQERQVAQAEATVTGIPVDVRLVTTRKDVRIAAARLDQIAAQAAALNNLPALDPATNAAALAAIRTLDTRQRQIADAVADLALIVRAVGKVVLKEIV